MQIQRSTTPPVDWQLVGDLNIYHAAEARQQLLAALDELDTGDGELGLDLSAIGEMDSSGLQLLRALQHSLQQRGRGLRLYWPSAAVLHLLNGYRLLDADADGFPVERRSAEESA